MHHVVAGLAFIVSTVIVGITQAEVPDAMAAEAPIREIRWQDTCPVAAPEGSRCGELIVPERRDRAESRDICVPIAVIAAPDEAMKAPDPLLWLMGGTGGGFGVLNQLGALPGLLNRDVIVIEQRGNPMAKPYFGCESVPPAVPLHLLYNSSIEFTGPESVEACRRDLLAKGMDLQAYTTPFAADDLVDLRRALGIESWNVYGVSYGGRVGTTLMRKDPEAIRSLTIDSAQVTGTWFSALERLKAVGLFFDRCAAAPNCGAQYPDLREKFERTLAELHREPIAIMHAGRRDELNASGFLHLVVWSLYQLGLDQTSRLPEAIDAADRGDFNALLAINSIFGTYKPIRQPPNPAYNEESDHNAQQIGMLCSEEFPFNKDVDEPAAARAAGWGTAVVSLLEEIESRERRVCELWGFKADDPAQARPPTGDRPTLIVSAEHDTIAPPSHGEIAMQSLENARHVVFPWTAHGVIHERMDCFFSIFVQFVTNPGAPIDTRCVNEIDEPVWVPESARRGGSNPLGLVHAHAANTVEKYGLPGRAVDVVAPRIGVEDMVSVGTADVTGTRPVTGRETLRVAAQTKVFTAAAILRLVEERVLRLDRPIADLLAPEFQDALSDGGYRPAAITVRQLLTHSSGLADHSGDLAYRQAVFADPSKRWTALEQVRWAATRLEPAGDPGSEFHYSDTGYVLLGNIIERASGQDLPSALRRLLDYDRIGLNATWFESLEQMPEGAPKRAEQYAGGRPTSGFDPSFDLYGGGGLVSTLEDQAIFLRALFDGRVFSEPETLNAMLEIPATNLDPQTGDGYAMGIRRATIDGVVCWGHGGFFGSAAHHCPSMDLTVAESRYRAEGHPTYDVAGALRAAILMQRLRTEPADPD